jgi:hypothetical protein
VLPIIIIISANRRRGVPLAKLLKRWFGTLKPDKERISGAQAAKKKNVVDFNFQLIYQSSKLLEVLVSFIFVRKIFSLSCFCVNICYLEF